MTIAEPADTGLDDSTAATLQHISMLRERELRLTQMRERAEEQMLQRLGTAHRRGAISDAQLHAAYDAYRELGIPGRSKRWNAHIDVPWGSIDQERRWLPNGPEGTWVGVWPLQLNHSAPIGGTPVVYILFDDCNIPCYVGSTGNLRARLKAHARTGKVFSQWQAYPCRDREHAYEVEDRLLKEKLPHLNRRAGR